MYPGLRLGAYRLYLGDTPNPAGNFTKWARSDFYDNTSSGKTALDTIIIHIAWARFPA